MCDTCGCGDGGAVRLTTMGVPDHQHHEHQNDQKHHQHQEDQKHQEHQEHHEPQGTVVSLEARILGRNDDLAARNRSWFDAHRVTALNLMSSPGSGKTTLLERTLRELAGVVPAAVVEGDQETPLDAERIRATGAPVVQVNTGAGCHLDATMVEQAVTALAPPPGSVLFVENVGNLVCPALFDLGERAKVIVTSVTEGADKPLKYPHMFRAADVVLLNKADLLPYVDFDAEGFRRAVSTVNPEVDVLVVSARTGAGMGQWYGWVQDLVGT